MCYDINNIKEILGYTKETYEEKKEENYHCDMCSHHIVNHSLFFVGKFSGKCSIGTFIYAKTGGI